jgi:hypothetical protein
MNNENNYVWVISIALYSCNFNVLITKQACLFEYLLSSREVYLFDLSSREFVKSMLCSSILVAIKSIVEKELTFRYSDYGLIKFSTSQNTF